MILSSVVRCLGHSTNQNNASELGENERSNFLESSADRLFGDVSGAMGQFRNYQK